MNPFKCGPTTGYQQAVLYLLGCRLGDRFAVRCIDRWYVDAVSDLFANKPYLQRRSEPGKKDYWCIKSHITRAHNPPQLNEITDWVGFSRAFLELQSCLDLWRHKNKRGEPIATPRLRLYGQPDVLQAVCASLPARPKKLQTIHTKNGTTYQINYQSPTEIAEIMDYLYGDPHNEPIWSRWNEILHAVPHK